MGQRELFAVLVDYLAVLIIEETLRGEFGVQRVGILFHGNLTFRRVFY